MVFLHSGSFVVDKKNNIFRGKVHAEVSSRVSGRLWLQIENNGMTTFLWELF